jgi:hypothetical protein
MQDAFQQNQEDGGDFAAWIKPSNNEGEAVPMEVRVYYSWGPVLSMTYSSGDRLKARVSIEGGAVPLSCDVNTCLPVPTVVIALQVGELQQPDWTVCSQ